MLGQDRTTLGKLATDTGESSGELLVQVMISKPDVRERSGKNKLGDIIHEF
jgi:hypothetical protein